MSDEETEVRAGGAISVDLLAHSRNEVSRGWHSLEQHLRGSAELARRFGEVFGHGELAEYLALVHDVGKGTCAWQAGLRKADRTGGRVGVPHKDAGMVLAADHLGDACGCVVFGHHGGMIDWQYLQDVLDEARVLDRARVRAVEEAIRAVKEIVPEIIPAAPVAVPGWLRWTGGQRSSGTRADLFLRLLFSCVVDADYLDTEAHFRERPPLLRPREDMTALVERFELRRSKMLAERPPSRVDGVRQGLYKRTVEAAAGERGIFVLHGPTGSGKTLAMAGFALHHAARHGMHRIIVAVPYISITEQNAAVYRAMLNPPFEERGAPVVVEHHSEVEIDDEDKEKPWLRLASENWDAPFVVTTTVQLFQSLFSRKPSAMRKLHRLAGSVIVLDEVQSLPDHLLAPILSGLRGLVEDFGATVLLASATQPEFWSLAQLQDLPARRIVDDPTALFERLRRVNYEWLRGPGVTWDSLAEKVVAEPQVLTVVNTTRNAASLHRLLEKRSTDHVLHLSRRMTAGHRRQTIGHIKGLLRRGMPVQAVSTSLVEAGVDFDFGAVFREETLPESMQQAAGRCNRENLLPRPGKVVIFRIHEDRPRRRRPKREADVTYEVALATAQLYFGPEAHQSDPDDLEALTSYYLGRYAQQQADGQGMGTDIDEHRSRLNFQTVAEMFQMIDDDSVPVIAVHKEKDRTRIEAAAAVVRRGWGPVREAFRLLQEHTARLPHYEADEALHSGLAESVLGRSLLMWRGHYHPLRGLDPAEPEKRSDYTV